MASSMTAPQPSPSTSTTASASYYCSQGICTTFCLQFCTAADTGYYIGPPPPLFTDDDSSPSGSRVSPLMIALISVLAAAFLLLSYYTFVYKCRKGRRSRWSQNDAVEDELRLQMRLDQLVLQESSAANPLQFAAPAVNSNGGLDEQFIRSITVFKYKRGDGLVESTDCAVCLTEFKDDESLRLMTNCQHAFHPPCIDTWLRSHSNCPICRTSMIGAPPPPPPLPVIRPPPPPIVPRTSGGDVIVVVDGRGRDRVREFGLDPRELDLRRPVTATPAEGDVDLAVVREKESGMSNH